MPDSMSEPVSSFTDAGDGQTDTSDSSADDQNDRRVLSVDSGWVRAEELEAGGMFGKFSNIDQYACWSTQGGCDHEM
ncbi:MAG: hypothetical protein NC121_19965 [Blautia sp.]|nr:hypothetical protein [Blautia sp.]